jgi:hypothetical protein
VRRKQAFILSVKSAMSGGNKYATAFFGLVRPTSFAQQTF